MSEMVERLARTLCSEYGINPDYSYVRALQIPPGADDIPPAPIPNWKRFEKEARAALDALRIPTPEMLEAANAAGSDLSPALPHEIWPAMIDAAIGKTP